MFVSPVVRLTGEEESTLNSDVHVSKALCLTISNVDDSGNLFNVCNNILLQTVDTNMVLEGGGYDSAAIQTAHVSVHTVSV